MSNFVKIYFVRHGLTRYIYKERVLIVKDTRITLRLNEELKSILDSIAESENLTTSDVIRNMINSEIEMLKSKKFYEQFMVFKRNEILSILKNSSKKMVHIINSNNNRCSVFFDEFEVTIEGKFIKIELMYNQNVIASYILSSRVNVEESKKYNCLQIKF